MTAWAASASVLGSRDPIAFVSVDALPSARRFYESTLGLTLLGEEMGTLVFDLNGTMLRVSEVRAFKPPPYTVLGWRVDDIAVALRDLSRRRVTFERFEGFGQDEQGVWTAPDGTKVAWFRDPAGNTLSLTQFPPKADARSNRRGP